MDIFALFCFPFWLWIRWTLRSLSSAIFLRFASIYLDLCSGLDSGMQVLFVYCCCSYILTFAHCTYKNTKAILSPVETWIFQFVSPNVVCIIYLLPPTMNHTMWDIESFVDELVEKQEKNSIVLQFQLLSTVDLSIVYQWFPNKWVGMRNRRIIKRKFNNNDMEEKIRKLWSEVKMTTHDKWK